MSGNTTDKHTIALFGDHLSLVMHLVLLGLVTVTFIVVVLILIRVATPLVRWSWRWVLTNDVVAGEVARREADALTDEALAAFVAEAGSERP